ncbi:NAD(P)H-hydrate dehydratase [Sphingosinicella humi]|uniref:Bifunctional NAD(P)H-hydrate repair enzyme n=1 Tax=Allosphingosinicella humi TaxID=2068657 RepID=A0A2U2IZ34_9SPHN|nr:NAD(P)H-hydrate dehydratase [Sphingosinicella humi]PWG01338.1 bifunctional ADP-dependent NAD(P)H-hydrate dehydratase/NAD(P)H-hydrate epimerase [Sphingosinicella humi]
MSVILTAAEMRAAEQRAIDAGTPVETLMERAGIAAAEAIWRFAGPLPTLILCGPGNNGGDGYVVARELAARGVDVRVAALAEPKSGAAKAARAAWSGLVEPLAAAEGAPLLIDALFGTGLARPLDEATAAALMRLAGEAAVKVAIDLPSGVATDDGRILSPVPDYELTVTFATLKPSHLLQPAARHMGRIAVAEIGIEARSDLRRIERPRLAAPGPDDHKYTRGYAALVAGEMLGAIALAAAAAARAGAGYVRLIAPQPLPGVPSAVVQSHGLEALDDERVDAVVIGPGLGKVGKGRDRFRRAFESGRPLVIDGDALALLAGQDFPRWRETPILTPHAGEFARLFGTLVGSKVEQAREAARRSQAVIVFKGSDTVVAAPDGRAAIAPPASPWLASAGTGDVLAGIIAAMRARGLEVFEAACAGVWLHGRTGAMAGPGLIADDLLSHLREALAECR